MTKMSIRFYNIREVGAILDEINSKRSDAANIAPFWFVYILVRQTTCILYSYHFKIKS